MQTPWFLDYLGLDAEADAGAVKRAYAQRLKKIDQATDIDGFMRLREAYQLAGDWIRDRSHATTPRGTSDVAEAPAQRRVLAPDVSPYGHAPASYTTVDPISNARDAMDRLIARMAVGVPPHTALRESLNELRQGHLHASTHFEALLIDGLASSSLPHRLALFHVARGEFAWQDVTHLANMAQRGQWLDAVSSELRPWQKECFALGVGSPVDRLQGSELLELPTLRPDDFSHKAALHWPGMQQLLDRFPRYLALRYDSNALAAWKQAFHAAKKQAFGSVGKAKKVPPSANKPGKPSSAWGPVTVGIGVLVLIATLFMVATLAHRTDASRPYLSDETPEHRLRAAIPELPLNPPIDARTCSYIEHAVHADGWNPPDDADLRHRLRSTTESCLNLRIWPNRRMGDPQLRKLDITVQ